jgi:hypothetical protein
MKRKCWLLCLVILAAGCRLPGSAGPQTPVVLPWTVLSSSATSNVVRLETFRGACDHPQTPTVAQTSTQVVIRLRVLRDSGDCTDQAIAWRPTVTLASPLGSRPLVDGG